YDSQHKRLAITKGEHMAWVEKLYMNAGLQLQSRTAAGKWTDHPSHAQDAPRFTSAQDQESGQPTSAPTPAQPTSYPDDMFLDWVAQRVMRDPHRIQGICDFYHVPSLVQLNQKQREELTQRLVRQQEKERQSASARS